jgi:hypothetical protein
MTMGPRLRKVVLATHVVSSVGWIGAVAAYLALVIAALTSDSTETVRGAFIAMELVYFALIPLAVVALSTGVAQALGSNWGLLRHYWVLAKFVLTVAAITVMVLNLAKVSSHADHVAATTGADLPGAAAHQFRHAFVGLLMLLLAALLGLYKPRGVTRYGRRKKDQLRTRKASEAHPAFES